MRSRTGAMAAASTRPTDRSAFFDLAEHCTANTLTFDGVFDTNMNMWDVRQYMSAATPSSCRSARAIRSSSSALESCNDVRHGQHRRGHVQAKWMSRTDCATEVDITFSDKDDGYKLKTVKVADASAALEGDPKNAAATTAYGRSTFSAPTAKGRSSLTTATSRRPANGSHRSSRSRAPRAMWCSRHDQAAWAESARLAPADLHGSSSKDGYDGRGKSYKFLTLANTAVRDGQCELDWRSVHRRAGYTHELPRAPHSQLAGR